MSHLYAPVQRLPAQDKQKGVIFVSLGFTCLLQMLLARPSGKDLLAQVKQMGVIFVSLGFTRLFQMLLPRPGQDGCRRVDLVTVGFGMPPSSYEIWLTPTDLPLTGRSLETSSFKPSVIQ